MARDEIVQFKLRIRESLRRRIEQEARRKSITANAEAVERLERSFDQIEEEQRIKKIAYDVAVQVLQTQKPEEEE